MVAEELWQLFQFLIGRLATHNEVYFEEAFKEFQFLIGRLATYVYDYEFVVREGVSIPYR